jgi:hypothetical protein
MTTKQSKQPTKQNNDELIISQLKTLGFSDDYVESPRRLIVSLEGKTGTGKTDFSIRSAPMPIILINVDLGTEGVVGKFQDLGKQILIYDVRVPREASKEVWSQMWSDFKVRIRKVYGLKSGTVVWDTASELYELCRLNHFGRLTEVKPSDYAVVNNEWREVLRIAYDSPMNTIFIHKVKAVWKMQASSSGRSSLSKTDDFELMGFSEMEYMTQVNLVMNCKYGENGPEFSAFIKKCRHNPNIVGTLLEGPMCSFEFLLGLVHD